MMLNVEWFNNKQKESALTIYYNNITFSKQTTMLFNNAYGIIVGIDRDTEQLVFKKVTQEEIENEKYYHEDIYKLTIKPTYGRINSRQLVNNICKYFNLDFTNKVSYKFSAIWNNGYNMLIVNIKGGE
jgi:hypothetical protein